MVKLSEVKVGQEFVDVVKNDADTFDVPVEHTLMLCWPPYDNSMAIEALRRYRGKTVIYVGEGNGGCTADDAFDEELSTKWTLVDELMIPQWRGLHDSVHVYRGRFE